MKKVSIASLILLLCFSVFVSVVSAATGADSGWKTVSNNTARVYTDSTYYGTGQTTISVTIGKSTSSSFSYMLYFDNGREMVEVARGDLTSSSKTLQIDKSKLYSILQPNSQGSYNVRFKLFKYGDFWTWYGDILTNNTFTAVRPY